MRAKIAGLGRHLPARIVDSSEIDRAGGFPPGTTVRRTGVRQRRRADGGGASEMGASAAREALEEAGLRASDVELLINAAGTTEQFLPDGAPRILRHLSLAGVPGYTVHATCLSFLVGLDLAGALLHRGEHRCILVVSSEVTSTCEPGPRAWNWPKCAAEAP